MSRPVAVQKTEDTNVRLDEFGDGTVRLVCYTSGDNQPAASFEGTSSSLLMLVDRINDRVHALREGT